MAQQVVKVAVTIHRDIYKNLEVLRQKLKVSRSALIDQALKSWLESFEKKRLIHQYVEGYKQFPEATGEIKSFEQGQLDAMAKDWEW